MKWFLAVATILILAAVAFGGQPALQHPPPAPVPPAAAQLYLHAGTTAPLQVNDASSVT